MRALSSIIFTSLVVRSTPFTLSSCNNNLSLTTMFGLGEEANADENTYDRRRMISSLITGSACLVPLTLLPNQAEALVEGNPPPSKKKLKSLPEDYMQGTSALADMDANAAVPDSAYSKLPSGVIIADLREGSGELIGEKSRVNLQWVLRKSNGYFVDSSEVQDGVPFIFTTGDKTAISGVDEGIRGMRQGGTRRLLIPPSLAYTEGLEDGKPGPLPAGFGPRQQMRRVQTVRKDVPGEYIFLEVQVTRVRQV